MRSGHYIYVCLVCFWMIFSSVSWGFKNGVLTTVPTKACCFSFICFILFESLNTWGIPFVFTATCCRRYSRGFYFSTAVFSSQILPIYEWNVNLLRTTVFSMAFFLVFMYLTWSLRRVNRMHVKFKSFKAKVVVNLALQLKIKFQTYVLVV
jgi:hypothetical protein